MPTTLIDNDILIKGACYGLLVEIIGAIPAAPNDVGILGAAYYVATNQLKKDGRFSDSQSAIDRLDQFMKDAYILEPTHGELSLAADLELAAINIGVNLGEGESQLCAMVLDRKLSWLATGDKRAIVALSYLKEVRENLNLMDGKVLCLEQLFARLLAICDPNPIRDAVCGEPNADKALSICFSCSSPEVAADQWLEGLESYIRDLRNTVTSLLAT